MKRRTLLVCLPAAVIAANVATISAAAPVAPPVPTYPCGCPRLHLDCLSDSCLVHDKDGRLWTSYSAEEVARRDQLKIDVQTEDTGWSCDCGDHDNDPDQLMVVGTLCIWSIDYYGEGDCRCLESFRREWLACVSTDWIAMMKEDDARWKAERTARVPA